MTDTLATDQTKNAIENIVSWYLADTLNGAATPITTKKFLTNDNLLVYLTHTSMAEAAIPPVKIQVYRRVDGGVTETGYQLFADHRFESYTNTMVFGSSPSAPPDTAGTPVAEADAAALLALVNSLQESARQTL